MEYGVQHVRSRNLKAVCVCACVCGRATQPGILRRTENGELGEED